MKTKISYTLSGLVLLILILASTTLVYADENSKGINIFVNGKEVSFSNVPVMEKERTLVPYKEIFKALGAETTWEDSTKTITAKKENINLRIVVESKDAIVNGSKKALDVAPTVLNKEVYVPVRFIAENLGYTINMDNKAKKIYIDLPINDETAAKNIDAYMNTHMKNGMFSGTILVAREGKIIIEKSYGMANYELDVPNSINTKYRIGSLSKSFTAILIMQLQEKGILNVNDPVSKYLPNYPNGSKITLHNLLTHTSGIPEYTDFPDSMMKSYHPMTSEELVNYIKDKPLDFQPGTQFTYSNSNYVLLGYIIEKITGKSYETILNENILKPLNMNDSGYNHNETVLKNRASGYLVYHDVLRNTDYIDMSFAFASGALYSTVSDLYKLDRALYDDKLLKKESVEKIFTPNLDNYGYAWTIDNLYGRKLIWHDGAINGFCGVIARYPKEDICIIILENNKNLIIERAYHDISAIIFGENYKEPKTFMDKKLEPSQMQQLVGEYQLNQEQTISVSIKDDKLFIQPYDDFIHPFSDTEFYAKRYDCLFTFTKDSNGKVDGIDVDEFGSLYHVKKIK